MPAELVRAVGRQRADDQATIVVEKSTAGRRVTTIRGLVALFVRLLVDDRLPPFLVPRLEAGTASCFATVDGEDGVSEAVPVDGYSAGLEAPGVVCVNPGTQGAVAITGYNCSAHISKYSSWSVLLVPLRLLFGTSVKVVHW